MFKKWLKIDKNQNCLFTKPNKCVKILPRDKEELMDFITSNPYILRKNEYPHVKGLTYKVDKYDQAEGIKLVLGNLVGYLSFYTGAFDNKAQLTNLYNQIIKGTHPCINPSLLIRAGLDNSEYVSNLKTLVTKIYNASPAELEKWKNSPLFETLDYIVSPARWNNWEKLPDSTMTAPPGNETFSIALQCEVMQKDEICFFDLFSMIRDTLNGTANTTTCVKAGDIFLEHLKNLPLFRKNYRQVPPTSGDFGSER